jgi:dihydropteroate synthase
MGILNVTPDSFSGDGLLASGNAVGAAVGRSSRRGMMADEGADILDVGADRRAPATRT